MDALNKYNLIKKAKYINKLYMSLLLLVNDKHEDGLFFESYFNKETSINEIKSIMKRIENEVEKIKKKFGVCADDDEYIKLYEIAMSQKEKFFTIPKHEITRLFSSYNMVFENKSYFKSIPLHARVGIDLDVQTSDKIQVHIFQIEQFIYEDISFNINEINKLVDNNTIDRIIKDKKIRSLSRTTLLLSFNLLEAYLNGIAFNYLVDNNDITNKYRDILSEYNHETNREAHIPFKNKIKKYFNIISGSTSFVEKHDDMIRFIIDEAKKYRDAIVHAKPISNITAEDNPKELYLYNVTPNIANKVLKIITNLIVDFDHSINKQSKLWWLMDPKEFK